MIRTFQAPARLLPDLTEKFKTFSLEVWQRKLTARRRISFVE
jgi:hypothetical protein